MAITIHNDFNEIFETSRLIRVALYPKLRDKSKFLERTTSLSDRTALYENFQEVHERYIETFIENFIASENDSFFFGEIEEADRSDIGELFSSILTKHPDWLMTLEEMSVEALRGEVLWHWFGDEKEKNLETIISEIEEGITEEGDGFPYDMGLKVILIYQNPKKYLGMLVEIINQNLPAYHKARLAIEEDITQRLANFDAPPKEIYEKIPIILDLDLTEGNYEFYPTFVNPFLLSATQGCPVFCGLHLNEEIERGQRQKKPKDVLAKMFKMLADQNKIEILSMLKEESMYNLQIANALGISAATTNHHMKTLLSQGFVNVEKHDGKVYYSLKTEQVKEAIADLEALLL